MGRSRGKVSREELEGLEEGETVIKTYHIKNPNFYKRKYVSYTYILCMFICMHAYIYI